MKPFSFVVSNVGNVPKPIASGLSPQFLDVVRVTIKARSLGSNTYMALGDFNTQEFRLNFQNDSFTWTDLPPEFDLNQIWASGDNAANDGIIEIIGIQR